MKKLFLIFILLIAFNGISLANTLKIKAYTTITSENLKRRDCAQEANELIETYENEEGQLSDEEEDYYWYTYYSGCMNS